MLLAVSALVATSACVASPYDGEVVATHPTHVVPKMTGYTVDPSQTVTIMARNPATGAFDPVTTTVSASSGWWWSGYTWYPWSVADLDVPAEYWTDKPGGCGQKATLGAKLGPIHYALSLDQPHGECFELGQDIDWFIDNCVSPESPEVKIETCGALCC